MKTIFSRYFLLSFFSVSMLSVIIVSCGNNKVQSVASYESTDGIKFFEGGLEKAVVIARKENKPLFVMIHASWCSVCKRMKKEVLPQKQVGDVFNEHFINLMIDYDSTEGEMIRGQYEVKGTPTFLFLTGEGKVINRTSGYQPVESLIDFAKNLNIDGKPVCR